VLVFLWPAASAGSALVLLLSYRRQRAVLQRADRHELAGTPVHVHGNTGPVVIGAVEPAIVVPAWLLERSEEEQRLVVAHEAAHIAAHDPQLLLAGCALVALMPWNLAAWFMLARLRLAIELDCDARVLARGTNTRRYGQLLIELSAAMPRPAIPLGSPAFSYRPSHLERRLRTMTARPTRFLAARRASALLIGSAAVLAACGAELPTATELQGMDVAKAESRIGRAVRLDSANTVYIVNGQKVASGTARGIAADSIVTINVRKTGAKENEIRIVTRGQKLSGVAMKGEVEVANVTGKSEPVVVVQGRPMAMRTVSDSAAQPLFFIDGKKSAKADMDKLSPNAIESVSVLKGPAAVAKYGAEAVNGVIEIVLKK
jgi:TonB-dependent SusC/RagA subfamily outer membrane receptor